MVESENNSIFTISGIVISFCLVSIISIFSTLVFLGTTNNFVFTKILSIINDLGLQGTIPSNFYSIAEGSVESYIEFIQYMDYAWLGFFLTIVISSFVMSYFSKRQNYFNLFSIVVVGLMVLLYFGGIILQIAQWFESEILLKVFPDFALQMPIFSWYLDNVGLINLIIITICIMLNYVDLDLSRFDTRKKDEGFDEI